MSSWTRAIVIPLSIVHAHESARGRCRPASIWRNCSLPGVLLAFADATSSFSWRNRSSDARPGVASCGSVRIRRRFATQSDPAKPSSGCSSALEILRRPGRDLSADDVRHHGARRLGYAPDHPDRVEAKRQFDNLMVDDGERFFFQPCFSPVWDTRLPPTPWASPVRRRAASLQRARRLAADQGSPAEGRLVGQAAERRALRLVFRIRQRVLSGYRRHGAWCCWRCSMRAASDPAGAEGVPCKRAVDWLLAMQSKDGGWAAFDVDNNWEFLSDVPFADHNAMLDPTCPDITGRVLEALARYGLDREPSGRAARRRLSCERTQEADGSWYGRWGVDYIYGTCFALRGLRSRGRERPRGARPARRRVAALDPERRRRLGRKLRQLRQRDLHAGPEHAVADRLGGAGPARRRRHEQPERAHGIEYLLETQRPRRHLGRRPGHRTGFPQVFYLNYHLYRNSFPAAGAVAYFQESDRSGAERSMRFPLSHDGRHGRLHRQEQAAAAAGMAEERGSPSPMRRTRSASCTREGPRRTPSRIR